MPTTLIAVALESVIKSVMVTTSEVLTPHILVISTLYFVPEAGSTVLVLVIINVAVVTPE